MHILFLIWLAFPVTCDNFEEELLIKDLGNGYSALHFNFITNQPHYESGSNNFHMFPKSLYQIATKYHVNEFRLSMTQGHWDLDSWGPSFVSCAHGGAEVLAWLSPKARNVDISWSYFLEAISGQFCASLSQLGFSKNHISPNWSYRPSGLTENVTFDKTVDHFRYSQLPHEELCTENLVPWTKLLPCKNLLGLAGLLKPKSLFKSRYNSLTIEYRRVCSSSTCEHVSIELRQSLTAVFDRRYLYTSITEPWSLTGLLGGSFKDVCPVASRSQIILLNSLPLLKLSPAPKAIPYGWDTDRVLAVYDSRTIANTLLVTSLERSKKLFPHQITPVSLMKYATGKGDIEAGVHIVITNHLNFDIKLTLLDSAPWFTEVHFGSLTTSCLDADGRIISPCSPARVHLQPSVPRKRMALLELMINLPANARLTISYKFVKLLLRWNEYPPDAHHGVYLPTASIVFQFSAETLKIIRRSRNPLSWDLSLPIWASTYAEMLSKNHSGVLGLDGSVQRIGDGFVRIHSETALVRLPVPDFSMPFNALCLVCSIVAIVFGSIHKATTNAMIPVMDKDVGAVDGPLFVRFLLATKKWFNKRIAGEKNHEKVE